MKKDLREVEMARDLEIIISRFQDGDFDGLLTMLDKYSKKLEIIKNE